MRTAVSSLHVVDPDDSSLGKNSINELLERLLKSAASSYYEYRNGVFKTNRDSSFGKEDIAHISGRMYAVNQE